MTNYIHHLDNFGLSKFCTSIESYLNINPNNEIIVLCIGTDRCTGDSLGPLVGYTLNKFHLSNVNVIGTLDDPVHAGNLVETMTKIKENFYSPYIIAVDACLGSVDHIGYVCIKDGPLYPGAAMKKDLPPVGNINITGIVNLCGYLDNMVLQSTRLSLVMSMSQLISRGLRYTLYSRKTHFEPSTSADQVS